METFEATLTKHSRAMTKQEQFAYCAGLLDGEGCFHASRNEHCNTFRYGITVNMDHEKPLLRLKGLFGGKVKPRKDGGFAWTIDRKGILRCVNAVIPYLMIKRRQAELLRELRIDFQDAVRVGKNFQPTPETVAYRQSLTDEITALKEEYSLKPIPVLPKTCGYAYVAGLVDGEGSFGIYHGIGNRFVAKAQIGMVDPTAVTFAVKVFSEHGALFNSNATNKLNRVYVATFERQAAVQLAKRTKPYRLMKLEQGDLVVTLQNHIDLWNQRRQGSTPLPVKVIEQRERWYQRCRLLNSESVRAETNPSRPLVGSDSPNCTVPKGAELAEMANRYAVA